MPIIVILIVAGSIAYAVMRYVYYKNPELFICLIILINFDFFYLLPSIGEHYNYSLTLLPVIALLIIEHIFKGDLHIGVFGIFVAVYSFLLLIGIVTAYYFGQPLLWGLKDIKGQFLFYVYFIIASHEIKLDKLVRYFIIFTFAFMLLADIDTAFFGGKLIFSRASDRFMGERLDRTRFVLGSVTISIACVMTFAAFLRKRSKIYGMLFFIFFMHIFFVIQTRMTILGIVVTCAALLSIVRRLSLSGIMVVAFLVALSVPGVLLFGNFVDEIGLVQETRSDINRKTGSWQGRLNSYEYYWGRLAESPVFGYGFVNFNWEKSPEPRLRAKGIFKEDIGISHLFYENGLLGGLWLMGLAVALLLSSWPVKQEIPEVIAYFIFAFSVMPTLDYLLYRNTILIFGIFLGMLAQYSVYGKIVPEARA